MFLSSHKIVVGGALARMLFILVTVTHKGKGSYHRGHPPEQISFKYSGRSNQADVPHNWTSTVSQGSRDEPWRTSNSTDARDIGGSEEEDVVLVGYGRDPWGPSSPMKVEGGGGQRGRGMGFSQRPRRNVVHLYNMVLCATGCNPVIYKGYGCYCGFLGSGAPIDGIDRCCKMHDWCYNTANCPMFFEYFVPYFWKCYHRRPLCAIDHGIYGGPGSCAQRLCECDRLLSECLSHYRCPKRRAVCRSSPVRFLIQSLIMF